MEPDRPLPSEPNAERLVLGTIMTERRAIDEVRDLLTADCFYEPLNRRIFEAITAIDARGDSPDMVTVANEMRKGDEPVDFYELSVIAGCHTADIYQHAAILHDKEKSHRALVRELGLASVEYDSRRLKSLPDRENPLADVNRLHFLLKSFLDAHKGFDRADLKGWLDLFSVIANPPSGAMEKAAMVLGRAMECPGTLRYRDFYGGGRS